MKFVEKLKNLIKFYITNSQQERETSKSRAILPLPKREIRTSPKASAGQVERPAPDIASALSAGDLSQRDQKTTPNNEMAFRDSKDAEFPLSRHKNVSQSSRDIAHGQAPLENNFLTGASPSKNKGFLTGQACLVPNRASTLKPQSLASGLKLGQDSSATLLQNNYTATQEKNKIEPAASAGDKDDKKIFTSVLQTRCPYCGSEEYVKRGTRQKKSGKTQLYICKDCLRTFTPSWTKGRQHAWSTILEAMSYYNLGFSLAQTCDIMKQKSQRPAAEVAPVFDKQGTKSPTGQGDGAKRQDNLGTGTIQPSTLASWLEQHKELCTYSRMRSFAIKEFSPYEVIETCTLAHRQLYRFRYHRAKTKYIMEDDFKHYKFYPLKEFLELVPTECPHQYFQEGLRASEAPLKFSKKEMIVRAKENYAVKLAQLVFQSVAENKQRHEALQKFMLANDSVTVATEVPVYLKWEDLAHMKTQLGFEVYAQSKKGEMKEVKTENLPKLITGHIDFLQIRNGLIHIIDYKAKAAKERPIEQLTLYALALSRLSGLRLFHFKCAWFDEKDYFEFFPLHVVYKPRRGRKKIYTKEGVYNLNERADRIEHLGPDWTKKSKLKPPF